MRTLQPKFLVNDIKREIRQTLGADLESIYHGLDTLLYTQDIIRLMSSSDVENLYNISVACNRLMKMYDQMIKTEDGVDDHHDGEGNEELFGHVSLITRTAVTEARALLPSLRGPHSGRLQTVDHSGVKSTDNDPSGVSEENAAEWPRLQRTSSSRLPDPRSSPRASQPPTVPGVMSSIHHPSRPTVSFAPTTTPSIDPQLDNEVAQNSGGNNGAGSLSYDIGGMFAAFDISRYMSFAVSQSSRGADSADLEIAAIFPRGEKRI